MAGIEDAPRPDQTHRLWTSAEVEAWRARQVAEKAADDTRQLCREIRAVHDMCREPDEWAHGLIPDRPDADTDEEESRG